MIDHKKKAPDALAGNQSAREINQIQNSTEPVENQVENRTLGEIVLECLSHDGCDGCKIKDFCAMWFGLQSKPYLWEFGMEENQ
jgi:hypothetical protein